MDKKPLPVPESSAGRLLYALVTLLLPVPRFLLVDYLKPSWQSGQQDDYAKLLLGRRMSAAA